MCVLVISEKRAMTKKEFENCFESNPDGVGFAWGDKFRKGFMEMDKAWEFYERYVQHTFPHVAHFRIGTSGGVTAKMTHPFIISENSPLYLAGKTDECPVLFQNGITYGWDSYYKVMCELGIKLRGDKNDTRIMATLCSKGDFDLLKRIGGSTSKWCIFQNGKVLYREGIYYEHDGILFSNDSYLDRVYTPYRISADDYYGKYSGGLNGVYTGYGLWDDYEYNPKTGEYDYIKPKKESYQRSFKNLPKEDFE